MELEESAWLSAKREPWCICTAQEYICNGHRIVDFEIVASVENEVFLMVRTVDDFVHRRPARTILIPA